MVIPWRLVVTAAAGILVGAWWASRRGRAHGVPDAVPTDAAMVVGIAAIVAGRLAVLAVDVAQLGVAALDPRAVLTLGAGVSTSAALLGALAAGAWLQRRGKVPEGAWRAIVPPAALGLAVWSLLSLVRGTAAAGVQAPFPLGWPLPGGGDARVPVGVLEAVAYGVFAWAVWRAERRGPSAALARMAGSRLAALLVAVVALVHLVGGVLRPAVPTLDGDVETLFGLLALALAVLATMDAPPRVLRRAVVVAAVTVPLVVLVAVKSVVHYPGPLRVDVVGDDEPPVEAIAPGGGGDGPVLAWDEARLAAFVRASGGDPVVVNVWASWCPPCRAEAPVLARAADAYAGDVVFLGVNVDRDPEAARAFARRYRLPFPSVGDDGLRTALGVPGLPTTVVLRADGSIAARIVGGLDAGSLAAAIDRAR